jgi:hypothetical protein
MFEERKTGEGRSWGFRLFIDMPWVVRAFMSLFLILLLAVLAFGIAERTLGIAAFGAVVTELTGLLKLVVGAIVGALSVEAKGYLQGEKPKIGSDDGANGGV